MVINIKIFIISLVICCISSGCKVICPCVVTNVEVIDLPKVPSAIKSDGLYYEITIRDIRYNREQIFQTYTKHEQGEIIQ